MIYQQTFKVFHDYKLSDHFDGITNDLQSLIQNKSENYILNVNETEYINFLVDKYTVPSININFEKMFITDYEKQIPAEDFPRDIITHKGKYYPKTAVIYHLPYTGNNVYLLECSPTREYLMWTIEVFLDNQCLCFEVVSLRDNAEEIKRKAQEIIDNLKIQHEYLMSEVDRFNNNLPMLVKQLFQDRKQRFLDKNQMLASLGVPIKKTGRLTRNLCNSHT